MVYNCQSSSADQYQKRCLACSSPVPSLTVMFGILFVRNAYLLLGPVYECDAKFLCYTVLPSVHNKCGCSIQLCIKSATLI
jgi:hypothetical protein